MIDRRDSVVFFAMSPRKREKQLCSKSALPPVQNTMRWMVDGDNSFQQVSQN